MKMLTLALVLCSQLFGCADTETTSPLGSFTGSECKMHLLGATVDVSGVALTRDDDAGAEDAGVPANDAIVSCISYQQHADQLHLTAMNFSAPCGVMTWQGGSHFDGDTLVVQSKNANQDCAIARCGSCIYDFTYDVTGTAAGESLPLRIEVGGCANGDNLNLHATKLELPLDHAKSGTVCRDSAGKWHSR
jgi:hypothetical protein